MKSFLWMELLFACVGLSFALLEWMFVRHITVRDFLLEWFFSFVYGNCVGLATWFVAPRVFARTCYLNVAARWSLRAAAITFVAAAGCLIAGLIPKIVYGPQTDYWSNFVLSFVLSVVIAAGVTSTVSVYERMRERLKITELQLRTKELERERALKLATEARLASLESRVHPHFLFNTINSVSSLIHEDPDRAERMLTQMAGLLRFSLDAGHTGLVSLDREMKVVRDYLDIECARLGERLRYKLDVDPNLGAVPLPPLSIQTLVENSVKYAVSPRTQGAFICVSVRAEGDRVAIEVSDDGPGFRGIDLPAGHGLSNLQERLHAAFGDGAWLDISSDPGQTSVTFSVPKTTLKQVVA
jgi:sensor histidine kinase YesM